MVLISVRRRTSRLHEDEVDAAIAAVIGYTRAAHHFTRVPDEDLGLLVYVLEIGV